MTIDTINEMDESTMQQKWVYEQIFSTGDDWERQELINTLTARAKALKCEKAVNGFLRVFKNKAKGRPGTVIQAANTTDFGNAGGDLACGQWIATHDGVWRQTDRGNLIACYHPILPTVRLENIETGTEKITIAFKRGIFWKEVTVDKAVIASASKIVHLAQYGVSVTSETAKYLVAFLNDLENLNEIKEQQSTSKLGWKRDGLFLPYDNEEIILDSANQFRELVTAIRPYGSADTWFDAVKTIRANKAHPEPQLYIAASFASVLVSKMNMLPFIVNLWGGTGTGKTVSLMVACSIWADPGGGHFITDSYATQNAFEIRLDVLNHLPLLMDDMSKVSDRFDNDFTDLIYLLCSGKGKDRSNVDLGLNKVKTWCNTILSNMERPLATESMKGGAINRILDFEISAGDIFPDGNTVATIVKNNFGHAGQIWLDFIREHEGEIEALVKHYHEEIKAEAKRQNSTKEEKQIMPMALMLAVDQLATDNIFHDGIYLDLPWCVSQLKDIEEVSEGRRAYRVLMAFVDKQKPHFRPDRFTDIQIESYGFFDLPYYVSIDPLTMREVSQKHNFSVRAFCSWAKKNNLLRANSDYQNVVQVDGRLQRFYTIRLEIDTQNNGFVDIDAKNESPFD